MLFLGLDYPLTLTTVVLFLSTGRNIYTRIPREYIFFRTWHGSFGIFEVLAHYHVHFNLT